jgi:multidrug efflux pump subunit AcrA (membrane-fusion protein)
MNLKNTLIVIVVIVLGLAGFRIAAKIMSGGKVQEARSIPVLVQTPRTGNIEYKVTLTGDIKAQTEVNVRPRTGGRVEELYVEEGDFVKKGQRLLSFISGISRNNDIYEDMIVRAPISGLVGMKLVKVGEQVSGSPGSYNPVFTLYDINRVKIYADVAEKDYSLVKRGTPAEIRLDAYPDESFSGAVNNVRPVIDPMTRTTQVEIILQNPKLRIKPGMFAKVALVLAKKSNVLIIPLDSVLGETDKYVFVSLNGKAVKKPVKMGMQQDNDVEVVSGLTATDRVIVSGQRVVGEGSKVEEEAPNT